MKLFDRIFLGITGVGFVGILINWMGNIVDPGALTRAVIHMGGSLGQLDPTSKADQFVSLLLISLVFLTVLAILWLYVHWKFAIKTSTADGILSELAVTTEINQSLQKVQDLEDSLGLMLELSGRLRTLLHQDVRNIESEFRDLCNLIVEHLSDTTYNGRYTGKVSFLQFDRFTFFVPMKGVPTQEFRDKMMNLPVVSDALKYGRTAYLHDIQGQEQQHRVTYGDWTLPCSSLLVVPIQSWNGKQGVFGIYTDDPLFFKNLQEPDIPDYFRAVLEVSAAIRELALLSDQQERGGA